MRKIQLTILLLAILATPIVVLGVAKYMQVKPESHKPLENYMAEVKSTEKQLEPVTPPISPQPISTPTAPSSPTATFLNGYWDGWHGKWLGPIRWTLSNDYRQGHMLGTYDKKNGITRYSPPK